ncbi:hypothetical protein CCACVL1_09303 [Corchorus capsularis]|uniref:Uncharacterized protein n=1 Tax=Corchorus capsularis TaxID=210143 RepID=A0A1R3IWU9_COCAP|nr:hypothetical protein CCACVL1_09303 [Corchorus capsularis]
MNKEPSPRSNRLGHLNKKVFLWVIERFNRFNRRVDPPYACRQAGGHEQATTKGLLAWKVGV